MCEAHRTGLAYVPCMVQQRGAPCKAMAGAKGGRKGGWVGDGVRSSHSTEIKAPGSLAVHGSC